MSLCSAVRACYIEYSAAADEFQKSEPACFSLHQQTRKLFNKSHCCCLTSNNVVFARDQIEAR
jgi:hypothetical protein